MNIVFKAILILAVFFFFEHWALDKSSGLISYSSKPVQTNVNATLTFTTFNFVFIGSSLFVILMKTQCLPKLLQLQPQTDISPLTSLLDKNCSNGCPVWQGGQP